MSYRVSCPKCDGSGRILVNPKKGLYETCPRCRGSGRVSADTLRREGI